MDAKTSTSLPWEALRHTEGPIPWPALKRFADTATADGHVLEEILDLYDEFMETADERRSYECLYVPAILAMAAPQLSEAGRDQATRFLMQALMFAGDEDNELMQEVLPAALGAFGPETTLPVVVELMPDNYQPWPATFGLWQMATLARRTDDPKLREPIIRLCTEALEKADRGQVEIEDVEHAGFVLARIGHVESRPLLERLYDKTELADLSDYLELLDGARVLHDGEDAWDQPFPMWLEENWEFLRNWYREHPDGKEESEDDLEEEPYEAAERRARELSARFAESIEHLPLSPDAQYNAESIVFFLLDYAWTYEGAGPEELTAPVLREVLLDWFPRKLSADKEFFELVGSVVEAFLHWLGTQGILKDPTALENAVHGWRGEIVARGMDTSRWGMGKGVAMAAKERGVDLTDREAVNRFLAEYNSQVSPPGRYEPVEDSFAPVSAPIVTERAKVGRNDPCPCGSGKKYKKCCGRQ